MSIQDKIEKFYIFSIIWGAISSCLILLFIKIGVKNQAIFSIKDLIIYLYAFSVHKIWIYNKQRLNISFLVLLFLIMLIFNYLLINPEYSHPLNNIRQIIAPIIVLFIYSGIQLSASSLERVILYLCYVTILIFSFGIFEQVFQLWEKVNLSDFFLLKNIPVNDKGLSYMFYEPMFNNRERMTSLLLDPISLGHFYATFGSYLFYYKNKDRIKRIAFYLCVLGLFLCLSKGAILQFFICVFFFNSKIPFPLRILSFFLPLFILDIILNNIDTTGIFAHINGFINSIKTITFFGHGIGSAGNYSYMFSNQLLSYDSYIGDTYIGALLGQIGLIGTLFWFSLGIVILYAVERLDTISKNLAIKLFISISLVSILSENTMNITSFLLPSIIIGICINTKSYNFR